MKNRCAFSPHTQTPHGKAHSYLWKPLSVIGGLVVTVEGVFLSGLLLTSRWDRRSGTRGLDIGGGLMSPGSLQEQRAYVGMCALRLIVKTRIILCSVSKHKSTFSGQFYCHLGAFSEPIFLFSSAMMLSSVPTSASHWATSAGVGSKLMTGSQPSGSSVMWSPGFSASLSNPEPASRLSHLPRQDSYSNMELYTECFK